MSWRWLLLSLLTMATAASAIGLVYSRHQHRVEFAQLSALERVRDELNIDFDRLQLEIATLADTARIERLAADRLGMRAPEVDDVVVLRP